MGVGVRENTKWTGKEYIGAPIYFKTKKNRVYKKKFFLNTALKKIYATAGKIQVM